MTRMSTIMSNTADATMLAIHFSRLSCAIHGIHVLFVDTAKRWDALIAQHSLNSEPVQRFGSTRQRTLPVLLHDSNAAGCIAPLPVLGEHDKT